jgi:hypothetical protein
LLETDPEAIAKNHEKIRGEISEQLKEDAKIWRMVWYNQALKLIIMPALMKIILPLVNSALSPVESMIPGSMKQIINVRSVSGFISIFLTFSL